jgi:hypothetical protein
MARKIKDGRRLSRRSITWLWILGVAAVIVVLIYFEQTALLYVLGTLSVSGLLVIVAMADLSGARRQATASGDINDSAALGSGITETVPARGAARAARTSGSRSS